MPALLPSQASLCWALPTLLLWRWQVAALRRWVDVQRRAGGPVDGTDAAAEVQRSLYGRLCEPVLRFMDAIGGTPVAVALAALFGFVAALHVQALALRRGASSVGGAVLAG